MSIDKFKITEMFQSLQGEGKYTGYPVLFIRLSGCNRKCVFCDSKYHEGVNLELTPTELYKKIVGSKSKCVVFTGGEPSLQSELIKELILLDKECFNYLSYHLETNATNLDVELLQMFEYISFSPKNIKTVEKLQEFFNLLDYRNIHIRFEYDIKIVTDLETVGMEMLEYATLIMPLSTGDDYVDKEIMQKVWDYCVINNKRFCIRAHYLVWGYERGK